jgi:hypothetical protein
MPALCWAGLLLLSVGCSNGRGSVEDQQEQQQQDPQQGFSVGGTVTGLAGSGLVLQNNGAGDLGVNGNGAFIFSGSIANGAAYNVTVLSQPSSPTQTCTVANGSGSIAGGHVTNVTVTCASNAFAVGGSVTGLAGSGLLLQLNGGNDLAISADGAFTFARTIAQGATYDVSVRAHPTNPSQTCTVADGSGTMDAAAVTDVAITCQTGQFAVGGNVSGMLGLGLVLQNNGADDLTIGANGQFAFAGRLPSGAAYSVIVRSQPSGPSQNCVVNNAAGLINDRDVSNVAVSCATNVFTIGGAVSGLAGEGLVLQLNGGNDLPVTRSGAFAFGVGVADGAAYNVSVKRQPSSPTQVCTVGNASGAVAGANVVNIAVTCATSSFSIGGTVSGLAGSGLVLQSNGGDDLAIASNGRFTFAARVRSGAAYRVTVRTQPGSPAQTCTVASGVGTVGDGDVGSVRVTCATSTFSVGGAVSGLIGRGLVLQNNGGDPLEVDANGAFTFARKLASGASYNVTVRTEPSGPAQACTVANGAGVIGAANVANVAVSCTTSEFTIGGRVRGLAGSGLVLRNNGGDDIAIDRDGPFTFATSLPSGASYQVSVAAQPANPVQTCTVINGSGVVSGRVTNIDVACVTQGFRVGGQVSGLQGSGLVLQNNGGDDLAIASNGGFTFGTRLSPGASYNVSVARQPADPAQTCSVQNGSGAIGQADVNNVAVTCTTTEFTIGGDVRDLTGSGLVLRNNGGDDLAIDGNGGFTFATALPAGASYNVSVAAQPSNQTCTVENGSGVVSGRVTNVQVACTTTNFQIRVRVQDLEGAGLVLQNNGGDDLAIAAEGDFAFATRLPTGATYNVTVAQQPSDPPQVCTVENGSGTVEDRDVDRVDVRCEEPDDD